jgi:hypothetical protein
VNYSAASNQCKTRFTALKNERSEWDAMWKDMSEYYLPRSGRFFTSDVNKGDKRWNSIYDSTGTRALRTLSAGMMSGMTSPARPWFRLAVPDTELMEFAPVKIWLNEVTKRMRDVFARSNTYRSLSTVYEELGLFGTGASIVVPDYQHVIRHQTLTAGEYAIATDNRREVCTLYREWDMTVSQIVREFGLENCSQTVKNMYSNGGKGLDTWITVVHAIEPRYDRDLRKRDNKNMPYKSVYFEQGASDGEILRESGFKAFPGLVPRWATVGNDIYGWSPAMEALGDVKQLQHEQLRKAEAIDYMTKPPLVLPTAMMNQQVNRFPGGVMFADQANQNAIRPAYEVGLNLQHLLVDIQDVRSRINGAFFADLFLMLANDNRSGTTAREIAERHEEKLLMLGPVLERLHNEMLDPLIDITFTNLLEGGLLPPPPQELQGMDLNVEFVSTLAQAQRAVGVQSIDRLLGTVGAVASLRPDVVDKLDADQIIDAYADSLGIDPTLIVADDKVAMIRESRAQAAQAQQMAAMAQPMQQMSQAAKNVSDINLTEDNALSNIMSMFQGYNSPAGV